MKVLPTPHLPAWVIIWLLVIPLLIVGLLSVFHRSDRFVADMPGWPPPLNDDNRIYTVTCEGMYALTFSPPADKGGSGVWIASSPKNLDEFCNQEVKVLAEARDWKTKPLCALNASVRCNEIEVPAIDIIEIQLANTDRDKRP